MMVRCNVCGRRVKTFFDHVDVDCESWPDRADDTPMSLLAEAERFISGFEGDDMQKGVDALLHRIRAVLPVGEAGEVVDWQS